MAALALQSELGSYEEDVHNVYFISEFRFVPTQSEDFELQVLEEYKNLQAGMTPAEAEKLYLEVSDFFSKTIFQKKNFRKLCIWNNMVLICIL